MARTRINFRRLKELPQERPLVNGEFYVIDNEDGTLALYNVTSDGNPKFLRGITDEQLNRLEQITQSLIDKLSEDYTKEQIDTIVQGLEEDITNIVVGSSAGYIPISGNVLPSPSTDNNYSVIGTGTYTQIGGSDIVVPENLLGIIVWDGDEWSLSSTVDLSIEDPSVLEDYNPTETVDYPSVRYHKGLLWRAFTETTEEPSDESLDWERLTQVKEGDEKISNSIFEQGNWTINGKSTVGSRLRTKEKINIEEHRHIKIRSISPWEYKVNYFEDDNETDIPNLSDDWHGGEKTIKVNEEYGSISIALRTGGSTPVSPSDLKGNVVVEIIKGKTDFGLSLESLDYFLKPLGEKTFDLSGTAGDGKYWYKDLVTTGDSVNSTSYYKINLEGTDFIKLEFIKPSSVSQNTVDVASGITFEKEDGSFVYFMEWNFNKTGEVYENTIDIRGEDYKSITLTRDKSGTENFVFEGYKDSGKGVKDSVKKYIDEATSGASTEENLYNNKLASVCHAYTISPNVPGGVTGVQNRFTFLHFSDAHYGSSAQYTPKENLFKMLDFAKRPDMDFLKAIVFTGDACQGLAGRNKQTTINELVEFTEDFGQSSLPTLTLKGNHDDNANMITANFDVTQALTDEEVHDIMFKPLEDRFSDIINGVEDECYYYADFENEESEGGNIRFIGLNCYDLERVDGGDGLSKYDIRGSYYSQKQIDWLENVLQNTPSDYHVVVLNHGSLVKGYDFYSYAQGWDFIPSVINAWKNGTYYEHNYENNNFPELNTSKEFDFTSRGEGNFVCYLAGHTHVVEVVKNTYFPDQNAIVVPCLKAQSSFQRTGTGLSLDEEKHPLNRSQNIHEKTAFNCISIDTRYKLLTVTHYGPYRDSMGVYKERTHVLNY